MLLALLIFGAFAIFLFVSLADQYGYATTIVGLVALIFVSVVWTSFSTGRRREALMSKYNDPEIVDLILSKSIWQGQSEEQLIDSLGKPQDVDETVLKTKRKETWKYGHEGGRRYRLRITLENGEVVGWRQR